MPCKYYTQAQEFMLLPRAARRANAGLGGRGGFVLLSTRTIIDGVFLFIGGFQIMGRNKSSAASSGGYQDKPKLVYAFKVERAPFRRRLRFGVLLLLAGVGMFYVLALPLVTEGIAQLTWMPPLVRDMVLNGGRLIAALLLLVGALRAVINLVRVIRRPQENARFFDKGFVWERAKSAPTKYSWSAVKTVIEAPRALVIGKKPLIQWGQVQLKMQDGTLFTLTPAHTDLRAFLKRVRPFYAAEIGARMGMRLRNNKPFKIHPQLEVTETGLILKSEYQITWENLKLRTQKGQLVIAYREGNAIKEAMRIPTHKIENLAGFMELATTTIDNFQRSTPYLKRS